MKLKLIFLFALLMVLMGCQAPRLEISIDGPTTIFEGETIQYAITFNPATTQKKLNWESSNPEVATVNENGQLIALVAGEIRLFARLQDNRQVYAYIDVTIKPLTMTIVGPREISAYESVSYTITFNPDSLQKTVNWESSNPKIATVNENGQLTGLKAGQVRLVARLVD
ncbi:MAG TPA: Ig-like domain-containing protein, partial [Bacilli bacterium]|nr:Ig-like domain-containing protein [Bacilli bacterium]